MERYRTDAGGLGVVHFKDLPFEPKRAYWLFDTPQGVERGWHAHKHLEQYLVCASGHLQVELDDGHRKELHELNPTTPGVHIKPGNWRILRNLGSGTVVLVFASKDYDWNDYIFTYKEFQAWILNH